MTELTDQELLRNYSQGRAQAFEVFYRRHAPQLFGYLLALLKNRELAEDALQDTFAELASHVQRVIDTKSPRLYLYGIGRHQALDSIRRRRHATATAELTVAINPRGREAGLAESDVAQLQQALLDLPAEQLEIIRLHIYDELSFQEAATLLQVPKSTLLTRYYAGLLRLRSKLHGHFTD